MKKMLMMFFLLCIGSATLIPVGFLGPGKDWAGVFAIGLTLACFIILVILSATDWKTRRAFTDVINHLRRLANGDDEILDELDRIQGCIMRRDELTDLARDLGRVQGMMVQKGKKLADHYKPEAIL